MPAAQGRPPAIDPAAIIAVNGASAKTMLQQDSTPRAVVQRLIEFGGRATAKEVTDYFGFDVSSTLRALLRAGWISVYEPGELKMPRRTRS